MIFAQHWQLKFKHTTPVTPVQGGILVILATNTEMTQAQLARQLGVEAPTVQQALDRLEALGCIARIRPLGQRRSYHLQLTDTGRATLDAVHRFGQIRETDLLAPLTPAERQTLATLLAKIVDHGQTLVRTLQEQEKESA
jgi:DNA-binding MarR family transcriptional regulator